VTEQKSLQNDVIENCDLPSDILRDVYLYFLTHVSGQANIPIFKGHKIQKNTYLKTEMNSFLKVRIFQPAHALLITKLCCESLRISRSNAACLFFKFPITCRVCIVFSA